MKKYHLLILSVVFLAATLIGCGENNTSSSSKTISSIAISPTTASIEVGATQVFSCVATYTDNSTGAIIPTWTITGEVGTIESIGLNGLFTATQEGTGTVMSTSAGFFSIAAMTVIATKEVSTVEVTPAYAALRVGQSQTFTGSGTNSSGDAVSILPTWTLTGDAVGTLTSNGSVTTLAATATGEAYVNCASLEAIATAIVTVEGYFVEITAEVDTYVDSSSPAANYSTSTSLIAAKTSSATYEAYLHFDISGVTPAIASVEAATLKLYATSASGTVNIGRISALSANWWVAGTIGTITWNTSKPTISNLIKTNTFSVGLSSIEFQNEVIQWLTTNNGIAIYEDITDTGAVTIVSEDDTADDTKRPKIQIYYK